jgi:dihydroorotase
MSEVVVRGGDLVTSTGAEQRDIRIVDGRIAEVGVGLSPSPGATIVDADGAWVGPGFVDLHTHLREPGKEEAETIESGANAAAVGGYSAVVAMPNTEPCLDSVPLVSYVLDRGSRTVVEVAVAGAITVGRLGERLAPMAELASLGVRLFTDDGNGVQDAGVMRRALQYAAPLGVRLAQHCEDAGLAGKGVMNEGPLAAELGLAGRSALAEELMVLRDIELVRDTGCPMHFLHLSSGRAVALVAQARAEGLPVSCEVAPHHFTLDESACATYDAAFKVHPPLRHARDVEHLREALLAGFIDAVATDHAPHSPESKDGTFDEAPPGMLGLEHAASLTLDVVSDPIRFFHLLSRGPARIAQLRPSDHRVRHTGHGGELAVGEDANIVVFDPTTSSVVDPDRLSSKARNTPYAGRTMRGSARATIVRGVVVQREGVVQ